MKDTDDNSIGMGCGCIIGLLLIAGIIAACGVIIHAFKWAFLS